MLKITNIPLSVWNRALELYGEPPEATVEIAMARFTSAESRKDITPDWPGITAFAQAIAEHLSSGEGYEIKSTNLSQDDCTGNATQGIKPMTKQHYIKEAICGYKEAIAFTDCQEGDEAANARWSREMLAAITQDVTAFITENYTLLQQTNMTGTQAGIDFWFSRDGHGAGFLIVTWVN